MRFHRILLILLVLSCLACARKHVAEPRTVSQDGVVMVYDAYDFAGCAIRSESRLTNKENGTDIPVEVFPARLAFTLQSKRPPSKYAKSSPASEVDNRVAIIPLSDTTVAEFSQAYPNLALMARRLEGMLQKRPAMPVNRREIPDINEVDCEREIVSKPLFFDFASGSGVLFITQYVQEFGAVNNKNLIYVFQGLTQEHKYYIDAHFTIGHPTLDRGPSNANSWPESRQKKYLRHIEQELDFFPDDSFNPPLADIKALLASITMNATAAEKKKP